MNFGFLLSHSIALLLSLGSFADCTQQIVPVDQRVLGPNSGEPPLNSNILKPRPPHRPGHRSTGFVALGDSYSAGIGTGLRDNQEDECRHGVHAYPVLIQNDMVDDDDRNRTSFQFLSCTGSTMDDLLVGSEPSQISSINATLDPDFALLSVGGNDLGFFDIMNSCIFRFYSVYSGTCEEALSKADKALASPDFEHRMRLAILEILDKVRWEKRPWFTITVTGYARFFNAETTACDEASFGVWWQGPKLRRELRQRVNEMVLAVNRKIRRTIDAINVHFTQPRVFFVNYDGDFEGHRFCEPNVTEPDYGRNETWFFLVGGQDNVRGALNGTSTSTSTSKGTGAPLASHAMIDRASPLINPETCLEPAKRSGDWGELALCMVAKAAQGDPTLRTKSGELVAENSMWYVPTYYGKTFHPRTVGHAAIRDRVYSEWRLAYSAGAV